MRTGTSRSRANIPPYHAVCRRNETGTVQRSQHTFVTLKSTLELRDLMRLIGTRSQLTEETIASSSISLGRGVQENEGSGGAGELVKAFICTLMFPVGVWPVVLVRQSPNNLSFHLPLYLHITIVIVRVLAPSPSQEPTLEEMNEFTTFL